MELPHPAERTKPVFVVEENMRSLLAQARLNFRGILIFYGSLLGFRGTVSPPMPFATSWATHGPFPLPRL